jgi:hypothetical protein
LENEIGILRHRAALQEKERRSVKNEFERGLYSETLEI